MIEDSSDFKMKALFLSRAVRLGEISVSFTGLWMVQRELCIFILACILARQPACLLGIVSLQELYLCASVTPHARSYI